MLPFVSNVKAEITLVELHRFKCIFACFLAFGKLLRPHLPRCKCRCFASDDGHQKLSGVIQAVYVLYDRGSPFERTVDGEADMH